MQNAANTKQTTRTNGGASFAGVATAAARKARLKKKKRIPTARPPLVPADGDGDGDASVDAAEPMDAFWVSHRYISKQLHGNR